jgi:membrane fusion protein, heavy metal efflux system
MSPTNLAKAVPCVLALLLSGCSKKHKDRDVAAEAPPPANVIQKDDGSTIKVDHPEQFPIVGAVEHQATATLNVNGTVNPDTSRTIPVISLANGRVVDVRARLGDYVRKGQLLMEVQSTDVSGAFDQYLKAVNDERLTRGQYDRAKILYDRGAIAKAQLDIAENSELDAQADLKAADQQLHVLGVDKDHPSEAIKIYSPATGVIIAQNVTNASAAGVAVSGSSTAFTIADLSHVWVICDVHENDLSTVHLGDSADIRLSAYPDRVLTGTISDIGAVLDPNIRTAKVRIEVPNTSNLMRVGMFATATFHGKKAEVHMAVPATAVLHLHDRDWVFVPAGSNTFRRLEVHGGDMLSGNVQEILAGLVPGQQVVSNALELQNMVNQ